MPAFDHSCDCRVLAQVAFKSLQKGNQLFLHRIVDAGVHATDGKSSGSAAPSALSLASDLFRHSIFNRAKMSMGIMQFTILKR